MLSTCKTKKVLTILTTPFKIGGIEKELTLAREWNYKHIPVKPGTMQDLRDLSRYADITYDEAIKQMMAHFIATDQTGKTLWSRVLRDRKTIERAKESTS